MAMAQIAPKVNNNQKSDKPMTNENLGTKKLCGINIDSPTLNFSTSFAVGSNDIVYNDPPKDNKFLGFFSKTA